ncbi:2-succinyl-6-hydroxy-2,4-cyclohexadiene-1-carboxylate synthase [Volucribacter amazonae]|uniref:Putative 2-succinyl-6-hydroxy-2,4-cyclohexadiene-1-carboxylate synthase n=1 Tax=Volucribacter amazonae TaxID=256731 RepID=A0A9X4PBP7_9PAST|nr:2-succinyl-6-hydroxy-2,4-cyclohexadiene-1-carboxylate synthase [Volucribacter amazonae]MDG6894714.1 2-succinyl-6-hydroxy-2,4-cyclohexadiene-1-carboxylate synthase [Volucribacter amazonae]
MPLPSSNANKQGQKPLLVLLHGLLGDKQDWQKLMDFLPHFDCIALDLPFHGTSYSAQQLAQAQDFQQVCALLAQHIQAQIQQRPYYLMGYSLGGRLALYAYFAQLLPTHSLQALLLEGVNLGLSDSAQRQQRWQQDQNWAKRFAHQPIQQVLEEWYQQPVFAHLTPQQRQQLIQLRQHNNGQAIARMLTATSLAKQPDFRYKVRCVSLPVFYFCGEKDQKFQQIAKQNQLDLTLIPQAGHNAHQENPQQFAKLLTEKLCSRE